MGKFTFRTAGETHGPALVTIVEGVPAGLPIRAAEVNRELARRQVGYGRGDRMLIEKDEVEILSGVRFGKAMGGPVAMLLRNRDWPNWLEKMAQDGDGEGIPPLDTARPGHADLPGILKYAHGDVRNVLERASARETAARVMAGAVAKALLRELGIAIVGHVLSIGKYRVSSSIGGNRSAAERAEGSPLRMADPAIESEVMRWIDEVKEAGTTAGGVVEVIATGVPPGLGSYVAWDRRLDGRLAQALMCIPAIKGVEVGGGMALAGMPGIEVHDEVFPGENRAAPLLGSYLLPFHRETNRAGGMEGGMTNGEPVVVRAAMKPIPTQSVPLRTVTIDRYAASTAHRERSDVCAVPAASVVAETMVAIVLADAFLEKFGGDAMRDILYNYSGYLRRICGE
ncbi:MAG: chorismate synthase [Deltaproteobacteria bacterium]|nr:chorismate synthase [Deltaproteobacteria bacterium]